MKAGAFGVHLGAPLEGRKTTKATPPATKADAGTFMSLFIAACYLFPLVGGFIADRYFGKYWTIVGFSIPYVVGQVIVGIENQYIVIGSLVLLAMGSGVIKPNISTLTCHVHHRRHALSG